MKKMLLWSSISASIVGVVNLIVYSILAGCGVVQMRMMAYLFLLGYFVCVWLPFLLNLIFKTKFNLTIVLTYQIFLILSIIVGSLWRVYWVWAPYDIIIHFASGVIISLMTYSFFTSNQNNKVSLFWLFVIVVAVALMCGGVWEIWEYVTDGLLGNNGQVWQGMVEREALTDTMQDLICDFVGGIIGGLVAVWLEVRKRKQIKGDT